MVKRKKYVTIGHGAKRQKLGKALNKLEKAFGAVVDEFAELEEKLGE